MMTSIASILFVVVSCKFIPDGKRKNIAYLYPNALKISIVCIDC